MSDPQKMTARELLAMLRSGHHNTYLMALGGVQHDARCLAAADLIDALKAENERLRLMAEPLYSRRKLEAERDSLRAENERLRKEAAEAYEKGRADATEERAAYDAIEEAGQDY